MCMGGLLGMFWFRGKKCILLTFSEKRKTKVIQAGFDKKDRPIDQMIYKLYGLTKEEIKIVTNAST